MNLYEEYINVRQRTNEICVPLEIEDYVVQPTDFVSPAKWHLAHTTWFIEEMILKKYLKKYKVFNSEYGYLFNSYYNTLGDRVMRMNRGNMSRPTVDSIYKYRTYVDEQMSELLRKRVSKSLEKIITVALNHEQQHQELLISDIKYILGHNPLFPVYKETKMGDLEHKKSRKKWASVSAGNYTIGFQEKNGFCFDNELGVHQTYVPNFKIATALVNNGEYLDFINDKGYQTSSLWLDDGWSWVNENEIKCPLYWHKIKDKWHNYTMTGLKPIEEKDPLTHVSYYEAFAYAQWKGLRLPTEQEWEIASDQFNWGKRWEWTNSAYLPYPGFKIAKGALGEYNGKFMSGQMVLRGASVATSPGHSRKTYRNFFQPHHRWQFTGIRLAK